MPIASKEGKHARIKVEYPESVKKHEEFQITLTVENLTDDGLKIKVYEMSNTSYLFDYTPIIEFFSKWLLGDRTELEDVLKSREIKTYNLKDKANTYTGVVATWWPQLIKRPNEVVDIQVTVETPFGDKEPITVVGEPMEIRR